MRAKFHGRWLSVEFWGPEGCPTSTDLLQAIDPGPLQDPFRVECKVVACKQNPLDLTD